MQELFEQGAVVVLAPRRQCLVLRPMIDRYQLPFAFEPARLKVDLDQISPNEWTAHFNKGYYDGD